MTEKEPMPDNVRALALAARARVQKLRTSAPLDEMKDADGPLACPYREEDWELWVCLLLDTFGTRNVSVAHTFMRQLGAMMPKVWDGEAQAHVIDVAQFQQALAIIHSLAPKNEAQAAIAVHCVALHLGTLKVTDYMAARSWLDPKTGLALAAITKAYSTQVQALNRMRKPAKPNRQTIKVQKSVTVNYTDARQVTLPAEGPSDLGSQPDATRPLRARARRAGAPVELQALPSSNTGRAVVPKSSGTE